MILIRQKIIGGPMKRSETYDERVSRELKDSDNAQYYLIELIENEDEPMEIEDALRFTIQRMGITDFANLIGEDKGNVNKFLKGKRTLKEETLNKYLSHFKLRVKKVLEKVA